MRFKCNKPSTRRQIAESQLSLVKAWHREFAWWPVAINDQCVWLESVEVRYPDAWVGYSGALYYEITTAEYKLV